MAEPTPDRINGDRTSGRRVSGDGINGDTIDCVAFDESAAELALEILDAHERDILIGHAAGCDRCRHELESLSATADLLVLLAPDGEPPMGFEQRAVEAMSPARSRSYIWQIAAALLVVFSVGLGFGLSHQTQSGSVTLAHATLTDARGAEFGSVSLSSAPNSVMTISLDGLDAGLYHCFVRRADGTISQVASWRLSATGKGTWAVPLGIDQADVRAVFVAEDGGTTVATAVFD